MNERMKDMKARIMMILMAVALIALPTMAQDQWQSTSSLPTSGSSYTPQVTPVGAQAPVQQGSVGAAYSPSEQPTGPRKMGNFGTPADTESDPESPLGDGLIPLTLLALAYAAVMSFRKRKALNR